MFATFTAMDNTGRILFGLDESPSSNQGSIDYSWFLTGSGLAAVFVDSNTNLKAGNISYEANDLFQIKTDNKTIFFTKIAGADGVASVAYSESRNDPDAMFLHAFISGGGQQITGIYFYPMGEIGPTGSIGPIGLPGSGTAFATQIVTGSGIVLSTSDVYLCRTTGNEHVFLTLPSGTASGVKDYYIKWDKDNVGNPSQKNVYIKVSGGFLIDDLVYFEWLDPVDFTTPIFTGYKMPVVRSSMLLTPIPNSGGWAILSSFLVNDTNLNS